MEQNSSLKQLDQVLHTITILEAPQAGRNRFCLLIRTKDNQDQDIVMSISGPLSALQTGKYEVQIPSKPWSKVEKQRIKRGYTKRAVLDTKEWRTFNCAPQDLAKYKELISILCEQYNIQTELFINSCPWAYFLFGKGNLPQVSKEDLFPEYNPYDDILI